MVLLRESDVPVQNKRRFVKGTRMATPKSLAAAKKKGPLSAMSYKTRKTGRVGALHTALGIPQDEKIPTSRLLSEQKRLQAKAKGDKKLSATELKRLHMIQAALRYRGK